LANIKSQIKRNKQAEVARERNTAVKSALKTEVKKFNASLLDTVEAAGVQLKVVSVALDKAASDKIIHANEAARKKATAAQKYNAMVANPPVKVEEAEKPVKAKAVAKAPAKKAPAKKPAAAKATAKAPAKKPAAKKAPAKK
jgi:small subunit ribosomal protein S20